MLVWCLIDGGDAILCNVCGFGVLGGGAFRRLS